MPTQIALLAAVCLFAAPAVAASVVNERGGIPNFFRKLARAEGGEKNAAGEPLQSRIVYLGGSITAGAGASKPTLCYRALLTAHVRKLYPKAQLYETNAAQTAPAAAPPWSRRRRWTSATA